MIDLSQLDDDQRAAVTAPPGPLLIAAGAGSGKTRVLTYRIAHQIETGQAKANEYFVSAFTKAASAEMQDRLKVLVPQTNVRVATFHSHMYGLLCTERVRPKVCTDSERTQILKGLLGAPSREYPKTLNVEVDVALVAKVISGWKNNLIPHDDEQVHHAVDNEDVSTGIGAAARIYPLYEDHLVHLCKIDFDDMLKIAYERLVSSPERLKAAQRKWTSFAIDEFQDTNSAQVGILTLLAPPATQPNLTAVGDDKQCQPAGTLVTVLRQVPRIAPTGRPPEPLTEVMKLQPAAEYLGITYHRLRRFADAGKVPSWRTPAGWRRFRRQDIENLDLDQIGVKPSTVSVETPIESVEPGDRVVSYNVANSHLRRTGSVVREVASRPYEGELVGVEAANHASQYTPEHRCVVKIGAAFDNKWLVYLMGRGSSFRIGMCRGHYRMNSGQGVPSNIIGLTSRAIAEGADAGWILSTHDSEAEARSAEMLTAWSYQIPSIRFHQGIPLKGITQESLDIFWNKMGDLTDRAERCLADHGRRLELPLYKPGHHLYRRRSQLMPAANLITGMLVLTADGALSAEGKRAGRSFWSPIKVTRSWYHGPVYSLDVDRDETYVADGIVTHNSIFRFRGAVPEHFAAFNQRWKGSNRIDLVRNYRSTPEVVKVANQLMDPAKHAPQVAVRPAGPRTKVAPFETQEEQAVEIANFVKAAEKAGHKPSDVAVLFRTRAQTASVERAFVLAGLPYHADGGGFFDRAEVGDLMAYLRLCNDPNDEKSLRRIINRPTRYLGAAFCDAVVADAKRYGLSLIDALVKVEATKGKRLGPNQRAAAAWLRELTRQVNGGSPANQLAPDDAIATVIAETRYIDWMQKDSGTEDGDESKYENIDMLKEIAAKYATIAELVDFAEQTTKLQKETGTEFCTIHRAKGREWPYVVVSNFHDESLPHKRAVEEVHGVEDERRLAYVAMTRASDCLLLAVPEVSNFGADVEPSRYLYEAKLDLDEVLDEWWGDAFLTPTSTNDMVSELATIAQEMFG